MKADRNGKPSLSFCALWQAKLHCESEVYREPV